MLDIIKYKININSNIREAVKKIDEGGIGFGVIVDERDNVIGIITDGDFRRAILNGVNLDENVLKITNTNYHFAKSGLRKSEIRDLLSNKNIECLPVLKNGKLIDIITKIALPVNKKSFQKQKKLNTTVVIMAGGKGTRMEPFTTILPKPLIPIRDKAMIEIIMEEYAKFGMSNFYVSVFYKANMIKSYFENLENNYKINYVYENEPLGTAGGLKYLEGKIKSSFFLSNCDILIKDDYRKIFEYHTKGKYALTIVTSMQQIKIPYGVCKLNKEGNLGEIIEKPNLDYMINTGMYVLHPKTLEFIPGDRPFNITDLIQYLINNNEKVGVYPISENSYVDIGQWTEYKKALTVLTL